MGIALAFSFAVPILFYAALVGTFLSVLGAGFAVARRRPLRFWLAALAIWLSPVVFFWLAG